VAAADEAAVSEPWIDVAGDPATGLLLTADHASARVPDGIDLGVPPAVMGEHVAVDIGVEPLARALCEGLRCPGILGGTSRLVIDFNREENAPGLIPLASDGHSVPGNAEAAAGEERKRRIDRYWRPYHDRIARALDAHRPRLLLSLHSFTPRLRGGEPRPWEVGILYNRDERAPRLALPLLRAAGVETGDNQPYSGRLLNATMNRHGEANGIPYLGIEVRQDLVGDAAGVSRWAAVLAPVIAAVREALP
jgi:predicted N-formylglutamate amidohydrolase